MQGIYTLAIVAAAVTVCLAVTRTAKCDVAVNSATPDIDDQVTGTVTFTQEDEGDVTVSITLTGFDTNNNYTTHGFHVHQNGDISGGCTSTGGHYNPTSANHSAPASQNRHVGDLGNIVEDANGAVTTTKTDDVISLTGDYSIIGKGLVVHEKEDDLGLGGDTGSITTGNAGSRLSCCVIMDTTSSAATLGSNIALLSLVLIVGNKFF